MTNALFMSNENKLSNVQPNSLNPKIIETWINETLEDAGHLDIPNVILKPTHKNPITRYGIDRITLSNAGIPNEMIDRIYRCLFVYSVGFFEMIQKCLEHTLNNYSIIKSVWRTYAILTEYCCKSDYQAILTQLTSIQKKEIQKIEEEFMRKIKDIQEKERTLKDNIDQQSKYIEDLERDNNNEKALRVKLEEEFRQNAKNHEDEVKLRLQFEQKLNHIHALNRELDTKYKRAVEGEKLSMRQLEDVQDRNFLVEMKLKDLSVFKAESLSQMQFDKCSIESLSKESKVKKREMGNLVGQINQMNYQLEKQVSTIKTHEIKIQNLEMTIEN